MIISRDFSFLSLWHWARHWSAHGMLLSPWSCHLFVARPLVLVQVRDLRDERVVRVWVCEQRGDGEEHLRYGQGWTPLILQDVEADAAIRIDVRMVNLQVFEQNIKHIWWDFLLYMITWRHGSKFKQQTSIKFLEWKTIHWTKQNGNHDSKTYLIASSKRNSRV